jgi:hypothetical protein
MKKQKKSRRKRLFIILGIIVTAWIAIGVWSMTDSGQRMRERIWYDYVEPSYHEQMLPPSEFR